MNCEYQTYRDGRRQDCGKPATHQGVKPPKRCYCAEHNSLVANRGGLKTVPLSREEAKDAKAVKGVSTGI